MSLRFAWMLVLPLALVGCGSDPTPVKPKLSDNPPIKSPEPPPTPSTRPTDLPPSPPQTVGPVPAAERTPPPPPTTTGPVPVAPVASGAPTTKKLKPGPDEFDPEVVGGRPIGQWMEMLNSGKKDDMIEALNALKQIPIKAKKALPRIEELTKNPDKEIAGEAVDARKMIEGK